MARTPTFPARRPATMLLSALVLAAGLGQPADASAAAPQTDRSQHFVLHSDISAESRRQLLDRLEQMLSIISAYWGKRCRQPIECYVVDKLANWPAGTVPARAIEKIRAGGGITISISRNVGGRRTTKSLVYATADVGVAQHEAVHAYCKQTFGTVGPLWYAEGMAELGKYWQRDNDRAVRCSPGVVRFLRKTRPASLRQLTRPNQVNAGGWQDYARRWALCHLLANNPNYATRFRTLGAGLLSGNRSTNFHDMFGSMDRELDFEHRFLLAHVEPGYRVDLCAWDWNARFRPARDGRTVTRRVVANRGWQPTRVNVKNGREYNLVVADGRWRVTGNGPELDANGGRDGRGRLEAVVLEDFKLSKPIPLGNASRLRAPSDGRLYLRCRDRWNELADNSGAVSVNITLRPKAKPAGNR